MTELLPALVVAAGFASLGSLLIGERHIGILAINRSFAIGAGASAAAMFPLSLLASRFALKIIAALLLISIAISLIRALRFRSMPPAATKSSARKDPLRMIFLSVVLICSGVFAALNARSPLAWDGFEIWASRAQVLYHEGSLGPDKLVETEYFRWKIRYPPLIPLTQALTALVRGQFDFDQTKWSFLLFYVSLLIFTFEAASSFTSPRLAMAATVLLAMLPAVSAAWNAGGYADMPQAMMVAGVVAAFQHDRERGSERAAWPWLVGSLLMVKDEGMLLFVIACCALLMAERFRFRSILSRWREMAILAAFLAVRLGYLMWLNVEDPLFSTAALSPENFMSRMIEILSTCMRSMFDMGLWGVFWPTTLMGCAILFLRGTWPLRTLALALLGGWAAFTTIFLFSTWPLSLHIGQSYHRLLEQLSPLGAIVIVSAYAALVGEKGSQEGLIEA